MTPLKFITFLLINQIQTATSQIITDSLRSYFYLSEMPYRPSPYDYQLPPFDKIANFNLNFPDSLFSKLELIIKNEEIVQARLVLHFKQSLFFSKASKHVEEIIRSLESCSQTSPWGMADSETHQLLFENRNAAGYLTRTISQGLDSINLCVANPCHVS